MEGSSNELRRVLQTPPPNWQAPNPHAPPCSVAVLHASLEHLRITGDERYLFLRTLIEVLSSHGFLGGGNVSPLSGEEEQLLFHCATGLRHILLFRWESFRHSFRTCVRDFLLAVGVGIGAQSTLFLPRTVSMACLSGAASVWKRGWKNQETTNDKDEGQQDYLESLIVNNLLPQMQRFGTGKADAEEGLFHYLNSLMASPFEIKEAPRQMAQQLQQRRHAAAMAASFLSLLVGEFSGGNSAARYNLPIEFHRLRHQSFECGYTNDENKQHINEVNHGIVEGNKSGLDATLQFSMVALSMLVSYLLNTPSGVSQLQAAQDESLLELGTCTIGVTLDVLSWEFGAGSSKWDFSASSSNNISRGNGILLRPPQRWRESLIRPDFLGAVFRVYSAIRVGADNIATVNGNIGVLQKRANMAHQLRQLLLQLSSIASGPIFADQNERGAYAGFLLDGCLNVLETILTEQQQQHRKLNDETTEEFMSSEIIDLVTMLSRLTANFRIQILSHLPTFPRFLSALCTMGKWLLEASVSESERVQGEVDSMEGIDWKNDAIAQILQCSDAMGEDYWLVSGSGGQDAARASHALASTLAPLYGSYISCRVRMACLEEHYMTREGAELDDVREEISALGLEEEMTSAASLGRLNVLVSMTTLSGMFQQLTPRIKALFSEVGTKRDMTPDMAALLEEARMLIVSVCHLLTDECVGETPTIPESIINACTPGHGLNHEACMACIVSIVDLLKCLAEEQAMRVAVHPEEPCLSPIVAKTLLWFFHRWGAAYILPTTEEYREHTGGILGAWSTPEVAQPVVSFFTTLCLLYFCHWPQEKEVQDESTSLLSALAKKGPIVRNLLVNSPSFEKVAALHSICASLCHNASQAEISSSVSAIGGDLSMDLVKGYQRLPYSDRAKVLTCLVISCSEIQNDKGAAMLRGCLRAVESPFSSMVHALSKNHPHANDMNAQELACLSIILYGGIVLASEMSEPERIPQFVSPSLPHLSSLMNFYAGDLTICESLLRLFRDYAEHFVSSLTRDQSITLFTSSASLLKCYSEHHCKSRIIEKKSESLEAEFEEEQNYNDVLCAIQLLIHLGTKDFIDLCNTETSSSKGVETGQITDVIFFGLQQILPLMTQGLLQFPTLCTHYFSLVGFMVETYPENLCVLPFNLFNSLLDSLLFGMSHSDPLVAKSSLQGIAGLAKEHLRTSALANYLSIKNDIFENCSRRLIQEVVFQPIVWDRLESAGMALLPLAATDVQKFVTLVNSISQQLDSDDKQRRLHFAFERLIKPEVLAKVAVGGREGRLVRIQFKTDFNVFVRDVQSFLVIK